MIKKDKINIIYQDKDIIVINKPANLLTMSTNNEKEKTLFHKVITYEKQKNKNNKVFIVHRLDRETSGLIIFAKNERVKGILQDNWDKLVKTRGYIAVVEGIVEKSNDTIKSWLKENQNFISYSSDKKDDGKLAITKYKKLKTNKAFTLLEINILTGRKNQIRVHMKDIGHPIVGDKKYGSKTKANRMYLIANKLVFIHPITKQELSFELPIPKEFNI